jgi:hypothetical protein
MAGLDLIALRVAIADAVQAGTARPINGYPYPKGNEELPCVVVHAADNYVDWWGSLAAVGGMCTVNLVLELMAPCRVTFEDGLRVLDEMMSAGAGLPNSVVDAVEADRSFGGQADDSLLGVSFGHSRTVADEHRPEAVVCRVPLTVYKQRS